MQLNPAQQLLAAFLGVDPDFWDVADKRLAAEQTRAMADRYKAPHAHRGTPKRPRVPRRVRFATAFDDEGNVTAVSKPRLFKGHRA